MTEPVRVSLLWFGTGWKASSREAIRNAIASLSPSKYKNVTDSDVPNLGDWWDVIRQYRDHSNTPVTEKVDVGSECFYTGPHLNMTLDQVVEVGELVFNKTGVIGRNLSCDGGSMFERDENGVYLILFSHTVMFLDGQKQRELMDLCSGKFEVELFGGSRVNLSWVREPQNDDDQCSQFVHGSSFVASPNGDVKVDSLVGYVVGKIADEVTDKDGNGWSSNDGSGLSVGSYCSYQFLKMSSGPPLFTDEDRRISFNAVGLNGYRYIVPYVWDQKISNCVLKPSGIAYKDAYKRKDLYILASILINTVIILKLFHEFIIRIHHQYLIDLCAEMCSGKAKLVEQMRGRLKGGVVVNDTDGLQPYAPNQKCQWQIQLQNVKFISFTVNYLAVGSGSDDHLLICHSLSTSSSCFDMNNGELNKEVKVIGSKASIQFTTGDQVPFESRGWEVSYSAGLCDGREDVYSHYGTIGYSSSTRLSYIEGLNCVWILHGKPGTLVSLTFTHINITKDFDFIAIYNTKKQQIANFTGLYSASALPQMNLTGEVRIAFSTQTDKGEGWSAEIHIVSPVKQDKKALTLAAIVIAVIFSLSLAALVMLKRKRMLIRGTTKTDNSIMLIRVNTESEENRIGEGPSAVVYRAVSTNGNIVAVKAQRDILSATDLEEEILLKSSSHPNIVSLLGYAQDGLRGRYLVFEYMQRGSLSWNLSEKGETINWEKRISIALQICSAIQMLHMYLKPPAYHGNITSENILLDELYNAKLGGFGTANYFSSSRTSHPEPTSEMAEDVWSFGLLLLELLYGQCILNRDQYKNSEQMNLVGGLDKLDRRLTVPTEKNKILSLTKFGEIAKWCIGSCRIEVSSECSPKIGDVLSSLRQVKKLFSSGQVATFSTSK